MGQSSAETVKEIEEVRHELDDKVRELEHRLPAPAVWVKRLTGVAVGGGLGSTVFWFVVRRVRNRRAATAERSGKGDARVNVVEFSLPPVDEATRKWLIGAAVAWVAIRTAQLRATRRTNRLLAERAA